MNWKTNDIIHRAHFKCKRHFIIWLIQMRPKATVIHPINWHHCMQSKCKSIILLFESAEPKLSNRRLFKWWPICVRSIVIFFFFLMLLECNLFEIFQSTENQSFWTDQTNCLNQFESRNISNFQRKTHTQTDAHSHLCRRREREREKKRSSK